VLAVIHHPGVSRPAGSAGKLGHLLVWATLDESALLVRDGEVGFASRHSITQLDAEDRKCVGAVASRLEATLSDVRQPARRSASDGRMLGKDVHRGILTSREIGTGSTHEHRQLWRQGHSRGQRHEIRLLPTRQGGGAGASSLQPKGALGKPAAYRGRRKHHPR